MEKENTSKLDKPQSVSEAEAESVEGERGGSFIRCLPDDCPDRAWIYEYNGVSCRKRDCPKASRCRFRIHVDEIAKPGVFLM